MKISWFGVYLKAITITITIRDNKGQRIVPTVIVTCDNNTC